MTEDELRTIIARGEGEKISNKLLAEAFYLMGEVEKYGTGFIRIRAWLKEYPGLHYDLVDLEDFTRLTIKEKVVEKVVENLSENQQKILDCIAANPYISAKEISCKIGISHRKTQENIKKLKDAGFLRRIGPAKGGYWKIA